jgi:hypothetical protein
MEPFHQPQDPQKDAQSGFGPGGFNALIPGIVLVATGALFLLGNLHIVHAADWFAYWPVILIAIGMTQLVDAASSFRRITGGVMMAIGGLFLADNLGYLSFRVEDLWPLILIGIGLTMLWTRATGRSFAGWDRPFRYRRKWHWPPDNIGAPFTGNLVQEYAIFGGSRRVVTDPDFKGGRIACLFGGVNLDLTAAGMVGDSALLEIQTVYGGATVRIPANWNVEVRGAGIFGGFADHTVHPPVIPGMKHLIVKGVAIFGGVTFKN